jgi:hypothetical protein
LIPGNTPDPIKVDKWATSGDEIIAAFNAGHKVVGVQVLIADLGLKPVTVPVNKTLVIRESVNIGTGSLIINGGGKAIVDKAGVLTASSKSKLNVTGTMEVRNGGTLSTDEVGSVDGLASNKVNFNGGKLAVTGAVANLTDIQTLFSYVARGKGELDLTGATVTVTGIKPSDLVAIAGISADKRLTITTPLTEVETATTLTIPEGLNINAGGLTLASVSVNLTVNGALTLGGAAAPTSDVTVGTKGKITVSGTGRLTIVANKKLENNGTVALTDTGCVVLKTPANASPSDGAKITGTGNLTAQDLEIVGGPGGWQALKTGSAGGATYVTIASTAITGQANIIGNTNDAYLKGGTDAIIKQKAGTNKNRLALKDVTVDVSEAGSLIVAADNAEKGNLFLDGTNSIVKTGTGSPVASGITSPLTAIGNAIVNLAIGTTATTIMIEYKGTSPYTLLKLKSADSSGVTVAVSSGTNNIVFAKDVAITGR